MPVTLNLARLLAACPEADLRDGAEAIRLAERACRAIGYRSPRALYILALAHAEVDCFDEAVRRAQQALQLAVLSGQTELSRRIEAWLKSHKGHRADHRQP